MPILELTTSEATFRNNIARGCHFYFDCACGGKDGKYSGSHYKNAIDFLNRATDEYSPLFANKYEHTFYLSEQLFLYTLYREYSEKKHQEPIIIVCNDCGREFSFTHESYLDLRNEMMGEYNRKLAES